MSPNTTERSVVHASLALVRDRWKLILAVVVLAVGASVLLTRSASKQYRTTVRILFRETTIGEQVAGVPVFQAPQANSNAGAEMTTNVTLLKSETVGNEVINRLGLHMGVDTL
jgi:uncharacterized protein involved in exopolysaccharide biosynthesis